MPIYTGQLRDVSLCKIENTDIEFLFGYIVEHVSPRFNKDDWFASSYLVKIEKINDFLVAETANSIYRIPAFTLMTVPLEALDNIRMGTPPEQAYVFFKALFLNPCISHFNRWSNCGFIVVHCKSINCSTQMLLQFQDEGIFYAIAF
jgi:hypothetical protein